MPFLPMIPMKVISILILFYLLSCSSNETPGSDSSSDKLVIPDSSNLFSNDSVERIRKITKSDNKVDTLKRMLRGAWTDGSLEAATFDIETDKIIYIDQGASYRYSLSGDMLTITYPDYFYTAKVSVQGDTLIMDSKEYGQSKFWRFKN
jgi:hypothetical protein